ncbi:S24 family peptidase [Flavobacterium croceum]|jgi:phage repressor protein C with HTH and peptisase S24 domain|uniref:Phage repressor protein C with HTH and peptisase S24 domain n=1 Tax=Flavobacterium croceum DSM 17960 TaxID=1121886 RepID=A0A2S4NB70_9FLAO|nr:S24 family peptidase [Flavobacterium croceum]POS02956.1 phage repressor protein C with HTH and peptisase S24 domain [Flavobacterium croceum DSM 17960]
MVSERVGEYIEKKKISYYAFENSLNVSRGSISKAVKDKKSIGSNVLETIMNVYTDINPQWLLTGNGEMLSTNNDFLLNRSIETYRLKTDVAVESQQIPLYDIEAVAGLVPLLSGGKQSPIDFISIPRLPKCDGAVYVTGDSMYPLLKSGDIVLYKEVHDVLNEIFWGEMYLLSLDVSGEEYVTVKYIQKSEHKSCVRLVSQNKHHQDKDVELDKIRALALVKASIRVNSM